MCKPQWQEHREPQVVQLCPILQQLYTAPAISILSDLGGEFEEHEGRENGADAGAHGAADQTKHQLNIWHQNPNGEADQDNSTSDHVEFEENGRHVLLLSKEPGGRDVVINQFR